MQTLNDTNPQTIKAHARKLHDLAAWYAETSAAEHLAHAQTGNEGHKGTAMVFGDVATNLEREALELERGLNRRQTAAAAPSIDAFVIRNGDKFTVDLLKGMKP